MWSATWPRDVQKLALEFCREKPVHIVIGSNDLSVNIKIKQNVEVLDNTTKRFRITKILQEVMDGSKILVFCQTKRGADNLAQMLGGSNLQAVSIHGDKTQSQRDYIMRQFKSGKSNILVATDLAARGLDVADIRYVINYDFPTHIEDYIHRVGRTGRAGREGVSFTFFTREDYKHASKLIDIMEESDQAVPDELYRIARRPVRQSRPYSQPKPSISSYPTSTISSIPNGKPSSQAPPTNTYKPQEYKSQESKPILPPPQPQGQSQAQPQSMNQYGYPGYYYHIPPRPSQVFQTENQVLKLPPQTPISLKNISLKNLSQFYLHHNHKRNLKLRLSL
jgi:superfamily II DNA/RNA helicase